MNHEAINKQIADFCEKMKPSEDEPEWHWKCATGDYVPNLFTTELNDMHKAETVFLKPESSAYVCYLYYRILELGEGILDWQKLAYATAAQRAEAFVAIINQSQGTLPQKAKTE